MEVTARGWQVLGRSPVPFRRPRGLAALPMPVTGGDLRTLLSFLSVTPGTSAALSADQILVLSWEIGILRAVGWSGSRILRMIIGESVVLCFVGAIVGAAFGVLAVQALLLIDLIRNLLEPTYTIDVFIRAFVVAIVVAMLGAIYPAIHAVRQTPMVALRYE